MKLKLFTQAMLKSIRKKIIVCLIPIVTLTLLLSACKKDKLVVSANQDGIAFTAEIGPVNIQKFDSYCNELLVKLYWTVGQPIDKYYALPEVGIVRIYISETGTDVNYRQIYEVKHGGSDSTTIYNLQSNTVYYFRLATFTSSDSLIGISRPLMTILSKNPDEYFSIPIDQKELPLYYSNLAWSPDGKNLALVKTDESSNPNIFIFNLNDYTFQQVTFFNTENYRVLSLSYSPDGSKIAYCYTPSRTIANIDYRIWILNLNNLSVNPVTSGRVDADPVWLTEEKIVFTKGTYQAPNIPEFYLLNLKNGLEMEITNDQSIYKYSPSISPSKNLIAYSGYSNNWRSIFLISPEGENNRQLTEDTYWNDLHPSWANDEQTLYFTSNRSGHYEVWSINIFNKQYRQLTNGLKRGCEHFYGHVDPTNRFIAILENKFNTNYTFKILRLNN